MSLTFLRRVTIVSTLALSLVGIISQKSQAVDGSFKLINVSPHQITGLFIYDDTGWSKNFLRSTLAPKYETRINWGNVSTCNQNFLVRVTFANGTHEDTTAESNFCTATYFTAGQTTNRTSRARGFHSTIRCYAECLRHITERLGMAACGRVV